MSDFLTSTIDMMTDRLGISSEELSKNYKPSQADKEILEKLRNRNSAIEVYRHNVAARLYREFMNDHPELCSESDSRAIKGVKAVSFRSPK